MRLLTHPRRALALIAIAAGVAACSDSSIDADSVFGAYVLTQYNDDSVPAPQACDATGVVEGGSVVLNRDGTASHTLVLRSAANQQSELHSTGTFAQQGNQVVLTVRQNNGPLFNITADITGGGLRITRASACNSTVTEEYSGPYVLIEQ